MAELLISAKILHGAFDEKRFAFSRFQNLIDLRTNTVFRIGSTLNSAVAANDILDKQGNPRVALPDLVVPEELKRNDYEKLLLEDHYIIESHGTLPDYVIEYGVREFFDRQLYGLKIHTRRFREEFIKEYGPRPEK